MIIVLATSNTRRTSMRSDLANLLPGVPWVESPFFELMLSAMEHDAETRRIAIDLNRDGYAVLDFPDPDIEDRAERIKTALKGSYDWDRWRTVDYAQGGGMRIQDAWRHNADVRSLATNERILSILQVLYGRRPIPFQTLNFPVGTQQHFHSDSVHFSCVPERFMCGVWLALEDIDESNGPLIYYPGTHKWPIYSNEQIGHLVTEQPNFSQVTFEPLWRSLVEAHGIRPKRFCAKKGQALIWAANLMHGGDKQISADRTRWSQVTHYYFENCAYYTPMASIPALGTFAFRNIVDIVTGERIENMLMGQKVDQHDIARLAFRAKVPLGFDGAAYLAANPDVAASGVDPLDHYERFGKREGRALA
jgi:hypothetical protein